MTQDKETLREAVARALCELRIRTIRRHDTPSDELEAMLPAAVNHVWREHLPQADAAIATRIEALEAALRRMIYETTHLSPMKPNGDHDCTIKADALEQARQALESQP